MVKLRSSVFAVFICSVAFAATPIKEVNISDPAVIDDFNDAYGDGPEQNSLGAVYGYYSMNGFWEGGGYWYFFKDAGGAAVKNGADEDVTEATVTSMMTDNSLHVKLETSASTTKNSYAGVGCNLITEDDYVDMSKCTALSLKIKGTGSVRIHLETKDIIDLAEGWGYYGKIITLSSEWTPVTIPIADLQPEEYSTPAKSNWTFSAKGSKAVSKLAFQVKGKQDAEIFVDDITIVGMTYEDFGWAPAVLVITSKSSLLSDIFSVNESSISFILEKSQEIKVSLTDIRGQVVRSLFSGKTSGETFSLINQNLSNGRYYTVISGKNISYTQPITIVK